MAFVYRAERMQLHQRKPLTGVGPGTYVGLESSKVQPAAVPFNSTTVRKLEVGPETSPGPGSYSVPNLVKAVSTGSLPVVDQFGKEKGSGPFASKEKRFREDNSEYAPGPGSYEPANKLNARKPPLNKQDPNLHKWTRAPSAPSIPAATQGFGYDETESGGLIQQKNPEPVYAGTPRNSVGPGQYYARKPDEIWKNKGTAWHKSRTKRSALSAPATGEKVGPGSYSDVPVRGAPLLKYQPSAAFASRSKRSSYIPDPGRGDESDNSSSGGDEPAGVVPGPGYYYNEKHSSSFSSTTASSQRQLPQSASSRFYKLKHDNPNVGPGTYGDLRMPMIPKPVSYGHAPFSSKDTRFNGHQTTTAGPGPGSYNEVEVWDPRRTWGRHRGFGTTEKRFMELANVVTPGPGYYPPDAHKRIGIHNSANRKALSVFASKAKRTGLSPKDVPAPGQYEAKSDFDQRAPISGTGNPLFAGTGDSKRREAAFNIKSKRFSKPSTELPPRLGPGSYDPRVLRDVQSQKQVFIPKVKYRQAVRFEERRRLTPGPGTYFEETRNQWNTVTYNITFTDQI